MTRRPDCGRRVVVGGVAGTCAYERMKGKQRCVWHWLKDQPAHVQAQYAKARLQDHFNLDPNYVRRERVPKEEWPHGARWCAGCQSMVPMFYCTGSRCKSCSSTAAHGSRIESLYGITETEYNQLLRFQQGRCYICGKEPRTKRLAVDHDHKTGEVRGLLCAHNENGCNRAIIANLEASKYGGIEAARRALAYLESPPFARMKRRQADDQVTRVAPPTHWIEGKMNETELLKPPPF